MPNLRETPYEALHTFSWVNRSKLVANCPICKEEVELVLMENVQPNPDCKVLVCPICYTVLLREVRA